MDFFNENQKSKSDYIFTFLFGAVAVLSLASAVVGHTHQLFITGIATVISLTYFLKK